MTYLTTAVLVSDFNGDGILDVGYFETTSEDDAGPCFCQFVVNSDLRILNGNGDGTFSAGSILAFTQSTSSVDAVVAQGLLVVTGSWGIEAGNASAAETGTPTLVSQESSANVARG